MTFSTEIMKWYLLHKRDLPWRNTKDPYKIWLSEIMLQQTRVAQGLPYYEAFTSAFPTVFDMAKAKEEEVLKLWQGLGYYSRARNLHYTAKDIVENYDGVFPKTHAQLLKLKGVGDYTASAIASICYNEPTAVVDGNVYRVLSRYYGIDTPINSSEGIKEFKKLASTLIPKEDPATFNQAIMEFGAVQCKPKNPYCPICPLQDSCIAFSKNMMAFLPVKLKKGTVKKRIFNYLVVRSKNQKTLLEQRTGKGIWQNLYQFPLLETENAQEAEEKLREKLQVILPNTSATITKYNEKPLIHKLSHQHLYTTFWIVDIAEAIENGIAFDKVEEFPVPILIGNFIEEFNF